MVSLALEDACYQPDVLEKVVIEEIAIPSLPMDLLQVCLIGTCGHEIEAHLSEEREVYVKILIQPQA